MKVVAITICIMAFFIVSCHTNSGTYITHGTTAFGIITPNQVLISADSKRSILREGVKNATDFGRACKVHEKDGLIYAVAGFLTHHSPDREIDMNNVINSVRFTSNILSERIKQVRLAVIDTLQLIAELVRVQNPQYFKARVNRSFFSVLFGMYENGRPVMGFLDVTLKQDNTQKVFLEDDIEVGSGLGRATAIGHSQIADSIMKKDRSFLFRQPLLQAIKTMYHLQARKTPTEVNDTINIITIDPLGVVWIEKHQECN